MAVAAFTMILATLGYAAANWVWFLSRLGEYPPELALRSAVLRGVMILGLGAIALGAYGRGRRWDGARSLKLLGAFLLLAAACGALLYAVDPLVRDHRPRSPEVTGAVCLVAGILLLRAAFRRPPTGADSGKDPRAASAFRPRRGHVVLACALGVTVALVRIAVLT